MVYLITSDWTVDPATLPAWNREYRSRHEPSGACSRSPSDHDAVGQRCDQMGLAAPGVLCTSQRLAIDRDHQPVVDLGRPRPQPGTEDLVELVWIDRGERAVKRRGPCRATTSLRPSPTRHPRTRRASHQPHQNPQAARPLHDYAVSLGPAAARCGASSSGLADAWRWSESPPCGSRCLLRPWR